MKKHGYAIIGRVCLGFSIVSMAFAVACAGSSKTQKEPAEEKSQATGAAPETSGEADKSSEPVELTTKESGGDRGRLRKPDAIAVLEARSGSSVAGAVNFYRLPDKKVQVILEASGLTPGKHGFHLHDKGDCSSQDAKSAGDHWNPGAAQHGAPTAASHHAGDLGNIEVPADGNVMVVVETSAFTLGDGEPSAIGHAVILHEKPDDLTSQPSGNAGNRIACGVVKVEP